MAAVGDVAVRVDDPLVLLGGFPALAGGHLEVGVGETILLVGPNGAGKTTLLRLLAGLVALTAGRAEVLGHDLARDRRSQRRRLSHVGHHAGFYDDLSVRQNLDFFLGLAGRVGAGRELVARFGLTALLDVPVGRLSAGQRQRCQLVAALARRPALLLLDEPHAALDVRGRACLDEVLGEQSVRRVTTLLVSHDADATRLVDRAVTVDGGSINN